jgi:SAM-dependent methyltransferase
MLSALKNLHQKYVFQRRIDVLARELAALVPTGSTVLDVGCGDGSISQLVMGQRTGVRYEGIDIMARPACAIPFTTFDGMHIPHPDRSFDVVQFVDVLHHTNEIEAIVAEAVRVSKRFVLIKDHTWENRFDRETLRFMDWVGNAPHGVKVIYNFKNDEYWRGLFDRLGLDEVSRNNRVPLYPFPFSALFGRGLHFVTLLEKRAR